MIDVIERAELQRQKAYEILQELRLFEQWRAFGNPILVGAVAYGLAMAPDIDMEIDCDGPRIEDGFSVLQTCAAHPNVRKARFGNYLQEVDQGLYWRLVYRTDEGVDWKIDMWALPWNHPGPRAAQLVEPLRKALTPETRRIILELKALMQDGSLPRQYSIDIYRAVIDGGIKNGSQLEIWLKAHPRDCLTFWKPGDDKWDNYQTAQNAP